MQPIIDHQIQARLLRRGKHAGGASGPGALDRLLSQMMQDPDLTGYVDFDESSFLVLRLDAARPALVGREKSEKLST